jgi:hypothetical protein
VVFFEWLTVCVIVKGSYCGPGGSGKFWWHLESECIS